MIDRNDMKLIADMGLVDWINNDDSATETLINVLGDHFLDSKSIWDFRDPYIPYAIYDYFSNMNFGEIRDLNWYDLISGQLEESIEEDITNIIWSMEDSGLDCSEVTESMLITWIGSWASEVKRAFQEAVSSK